MAAKRRPPATAVDSSVLVASLLAAHEANAAALAAIESVLAKEGGFQLAVHSAIETYAVLTRLPAPLRLSAADAANLLSETCGAYARLAPAPAVTRCWEFLRRLAAARVVGGRTYDALILSAVVAAGARHLLTLNPRHFDGLAPPGFEVVGIAQATSRAD